MTRSVLRGLALIALLAPGLTDCARGPQCVPYARSITGIQLSGRAAGWWYQSAGLYAHSSQPVSGAVLVLRATRGMPDGHVSVVRRIVNSREIQVAQANWEPGRIDRNSPVIDVSAANDWSLVQVWWRPAQRLGARLYPAYGFIVPRAAGAD